MTATRKVRPEQHGTYTGYTYGCRCDDCKRACSARNGYHSTVDCVQPLNEAGTTSRCQQIQAQLTRSESEVKRIAHMANRSKASFDRCSAELAEAKAWRQTHRESRDLHMTECSGALQRWSA